MKIKKTPWWSHMTPLTQSQELNLSLPVWQAVKRLKEGEVTVDDFGKMLAYLNIGLELTRWFEEREELEEVIGKGKEAVWRCILCSQRNKPFIEDDFDLIRESVELSDDMIKHCEGFRVRNAIKKLRMERK